MLLIFKRRLKKCDICPVFPIHSIPILFYVSALYIIYNYASYNFTDYQKKSYFLSDECFNPFYPFFIIIYPPLTPMILHLFSFHS